MPKPSVFTSSNTSLSLLERVRGQDQEAWHRLLHIYGPLVIFWIQSSGLDETNAVDVAQEAVAILGGVFEKLDPRAEELGEKSLRSQLGEQLDRAALQIGSDEIVDLKTVASLLNTLGNTRYGLGQYPQASHERFLF